LAITLTLGASWGVALLLQIAVGARYPAISAADVRVHGVAQLLDGLGDGADRAQAAQFQPAADAHQHRLRGRAPLKAIVADG
jgi:hypothetical protein